MILLDDSLGNVSLIFMISLILPLEACAYKQLFELEDWNFDDWIFLKYLDLAKMLLFGLEGMGGGILNLFTFSQLWGWCWFSQISCWTVKKYIV